MKKFKAEYSLYEYKSLLVKGFPLSFQPFYVEYVNSSIHGNVQVFELNGVYVCFSIRRKMGIRFVHLISEIYATKNVIIDYSKFYIELSDYLFVNKVVAVFPPQHLHNYKEVPLGANKYTLGIINLKLDTSLEGLFQCFKPVYRRHIKMAQKEGVKIEIGLHLFDDFYEFYHKRMILNNAVFDQKDTLKQIIEKAPEKAVCAVACLNGKIEAVILNIHDTNTAFYMWGASGNESHNGSFRLLHWELIQYYHNLGIKNYSLGGYRSLGEKTRKQENLENFKLGFGASIMSGFHFYWILKPIQYYLYKKVSVLVQFLKK